jgi:hypothetical protein
MARPLPPVAARLGLWAGLTALGLGAVAGLTPAAQAQRVVPKIGSICPMGYVDTLNGKCSTLGLVRYTVQPTNGQPCLSGWMNVGGGYCRKK